MVEQVVQYRLIIVQRYSKFFNTMQTKQELLELLALADENEAKQAQRIEEQKILSDKRKELIQLSEKLRSKARENALSGNVSDSVHFEEMAKDAEKQAREILLDGEVQNAEIESGGFVPSEHFGKGSRWTFFPFFRTISVILSILILGYCSHVVQGMKTQISISFFSEMQHFAITVLCWSLMWYFIDLLMYKKYRAFYDYLNTSEYPTNDLVSKCLDSKFSEIYVLSFYCFQALSFVLMYLHNPITNS